MGYSGSIQNQKKGKNYHLMRHNKQQVMWDDELIEIRHEGKELHAYYDDEDDPRYGERCPEYIECEILALFAR